MAEIGAPLQALVPEMAGIAGDRSEFATILAPRRHAGVPAVVIGENNAGKSNAIDALRLLFEPDAGPRARRWITEQDFRHDVDQHVVLLGGPLDERRALLVMDLEGEAAVRACLAADPWADGTLIIQHVEPWTLWLRAHASPID